MYMLEKKLTAWVEAELKRHISFLTHWQVKRCEKNSQDSKADMLLTARYKGKIYRFCIEVKRAGYPQYVREGIFHLEEYRKANPLCYPIIAVPRLGEQGKKICNKHKVGYIDFDGNMKITFGSIYIEIEGKRTKLPYLTQGQSLFSPKAVRVTKCLLYEPDRKWTQKDIAQKAQLSKGMISRLVKRMVETGYLIEEGKKLSLANFDDLLKAWLEEALNRREIKKCYYVWAQNPQRLMQTISNELARRDVQYAFTQEAGASLIAPFSSFDIVTIYIEGFDKFPVNFLSASETNKGFNVVLLEAPGETIFKDAQEKDGMKVVDNLQLYVDLMKNPLRGSKQAEHVLNVIRRELK